MRSMRGAGRWLPGLGILLVLGAMAAGCPRGPRTELEEARLQTQRQPENAGVWAELGDLYYEAEQLNDAYIAYRRAAELDAESFAAHVGMAQVSLRLNDPQSGLSSIAKALAKDPLNVEALGLRGRLKLASGEVETAVPDLERAIRDEARIENTNARIENRLALVSAHRLLQRQDKAMELAAQTADVYRSEGRVHYIHGTLLEATQRWPEAERAYRLAINYDPELLRAKFRLADMLIGRSTNPEVLKEARQLALQVDGEDAGDGTARGLAAWALYLQGEKHNGLLELTRVYQDFPDNLRVLVWINRGAKELGDEKLEQASGQAIRRLLTEHRIGAE